jgi:hypothetical protein
MPHPHEARAIELVLAEVRTERWRQIDKLGYDSAHDDSHGVEVFMSLAEDHLQDAAEQLRRGAGYSARENMIEAAALIAAGIERFDRAKEAGS